MGAFRHERRVVDDGDEFGGIDTFDKEVDARGLNCPLPILRAKKALAEMQSGQLLKVLATDPGAQRDFAAFAKMTGNTLMATADEGGTLVFLLRRR